MNFLSFLVGRNLLIKSFYFQLKPLLLKLTKPRNTIIRISSIGFLFHFFPPFRDEWKILKLSRRYYNNRSISQERILPFLRKKLSLTPTSRYHHAPFQQVYFLPCQQRASSMVKARLRALSLHQVEGLSSSLGQRWCRWCWFQPWWMKRHHHF